MNNIVFFERRVFIFNMKVEEKNIIILKKVFDLMFNLDKMEFYWV